MNQIKQFRKLHNLSVRELARLLKVNVRTVHRWEDGTRIPHPMTLELLEKLGKDLTSLVGKDEG